MILLAGYPATGKSYMCRKIQERYPGFISVNQDEIKEQKWDEYGFDNLEEKSRLEQRAWEEYYASLEQNMEEENLLISDYPFSDKQKTRLEELSTRYGYSVITIRAIGNIDQLYEIWIKADILVIWSVSITRGIRWKIVLRQIVWCRMKYLKTDVCIKDMTPFN